MHNNTLRTCVFLCIEKPFLLWICIKRLWNCIGMLGVMFFIRVITTWFMKPNHNYYEKIATRQILVTHVLWWRMSVVRGLNRHELYIMECMVSSIEWWNDDCGSWNQHWIWKLNQDILPTICCNSLPWMWNRIKAYNVDTFLYQNLYFLIFEPIMFL